MTEPIKKPSNWEKITASSSMLVALYMISIWQGYSMQQHNQLSLRPYLETEFNTADNGRWELFINNNGMGPAQVKDVQYFVDKKSYTNRDEFLRALGEDPKCFGRGNITRFYKVDDRQMVYTTLNKSCYKTESALMTMLSQCKLSSIISPYMARLFSW